ncbi:hypothetical protein FGF1_33040 [Flavobacteriaceae bacterium GF1]
MQQNERIKEFLAKGTDMAKLDDTLKIWVTQIKDEELRDELSQTLDERYGVKKTPEKGFVLRYIRPILATAASLALLVTLYMVNQNDVSPHALATQYLDSQILQHPGGFKGIAKSDLNKTLGIRAFNNGDFEKAILQFERIASPNEEDIHYLGLAYLKNGQYQKAIEQLKNGTSETSRFQEEANWFLSLAYVLDGEDKAARYRLGQIEKGEWQFDEAQELMEKLKK